jgi:DNA-binding protein H-NS
LNQITEPIDLNVNPTSGDQSMSEESTYLVTMGRIEALKREAEEQKKNELGPMIERFKKAVEVYGIGPLDIFSREQIAATLPQQTPAPAFVQQAKSTYSAQPQKPGSKAAKYADGKGGTWTGYGRKPQWFIDAISRGVDPQTLLIPGQVPDRVIKTPVVVGSVAPVTPQMVQVQQRPGSKPPKYADGKGGTWTGYGRKPQWFIDATAQGADPQTFLIPGQVQDRVLKAPVVAAQAAAPGAPSGAALMDQQRAQRQEKPVRVDPVTGQKKGYSLGEHYWTGVGPRPKWFKEAVSSGKTLEQLRA